MFEEAVLGFSESLAIALEPAFFWFYGGESERVEYPLSLRAERTVCYIGLCNAIVAQVSQVLKPLV